MTDLIIVLSGTAFGVFIGIGVRKIMTINYIKPGSDVDVVVASLRTAVEAMQYSKYLMSLIDNVKLVGIVRDEIRELDRYLADVEGQAENMAANDDEEAVRLMDRLGGFA